MRECIMESYNKSLNGYMLFVSHLKNNIFGLKFNVSIFSMRKKNKMTNNP